MELLSGDRNWNPDHRSRENGHGGYSSAIVSGTAAPAHSPKPGGEDATSLGSNVSQKMIIRKDTTWHVDSDLGSGL